MIETTKLWLEKYLGLVAVAFIGVFGPIVPIFGTMIVLVFCDFTLGYWASKKRGECFESAKGRDTLSKAFIYSILLGVTYLADVYITKGAPPAFKLCSSLIALVELASIYENASEILGKSVFKILVSKIGSRNRH